VGADASLSVVVPTRDRPEALERCLEALRHQARAELDIVVVDDGSVDDAAVRETVARHTQARILRLEGKGPAAARNAGIRATTSAVVLMTDDDCIPEPDWARTLADSILEHGADAVGGLTMPPPWASAAARATEVVVRHVEETSGLVITANLGCRREVLLAFPFDESFPLAAGEDRDWSARVRAAGLNVAREPAAVVLHAPALGVRRFWRQHVRYGKAARTLMSRETSTFQGPAFYGGLFRSGFREGPVVGFFVLVAQLATVIGYVSARLRQMGDGAERD
jgi:glycosyltransferase involved in cell wall biosynthesis